MFCPTCGIEDRTRTQFCRGCGAELRIVRAALQQPDATNPATLIAREEISKAIAARIREIEDADDLRQVVEDVLPKVEKFLESPAERRMRRIREGVITASTGLGITILSMLLSFVISEKPFLAMTGAGILVFLIGLGITLGGFYFSGSAKRTLRESFDDANKQAVSLPDVPVSTSKIDALPQIGSVVEHTTHRLPQDFHLSPDRPRNTRE